MGTRALGRGWQRPQETMRVESISTGKLIPGIVLPLIAEEIAHAVESFKQWPRTCSTVTLNRSFFSRKYFLLGSIVNWEMQVFQRLALKR